MTLHNITLMQALGFVGELAGIPMQITADAVVFGDCTKVKVQAPSSTEPLAALAQFDIFIQNDGTLQLENKPVDLAILCAQIKEAGPKNPVIRVRASKAVPYARVVEVLDAIKTSGVKQVVFDTGL